MRKMFLVIVLRKSWTLLINKEMSLRDLVVVLQIRKRGGVGEGGW